VEIPEDELGSLFRWRDDYLGNWLSGERSYKPSIFIVHLIDNAIVEAPSKSLKAARFAEYLVLQNIAQHESSVGIAIDFVDLAIALTLLNRADIPSVFHKRAVDILEKRSESGELWINRNSVSGLGRKNLAGCSSIYALMFALQSGSLASLGLDKSIEQHVSWLLNDAARIDDLILSDLEPRLRVPEPWFNALVIEFLEKVHHAQSIRLQRKLLEEYQGRKSFKTIPWENLALQEEVRNAIESNLLDEARKHQRTGQPMRTCSAILFGPPGTAKTTIAESVAVSLDRPFVEIGVSDFLMGGLDGVFARSRQIFSDLSKLDRAVILLDEVEGVFANREADGRNLLQKFLTSALLPPLKKLREGGTNIIFIATNHIREFDKAAKRPGRVDLILPVGPPSGRARLQLLTDVVGLSSPEAAEIDKRLDPRATLAEIFALKNIKNTDVSPSKLHGEWEAEYGESLEISEDEYEGFLKDVKEYARFSH